ncbi:alpha/beta fold hydrolase [Paenibacillus sp. y28]|uniref:alpha/beta fold hydrolase n=1 Tax=Paenibacillus sp. y28 TaxID=3129110 RepID=UPI003019AC83
MNGTVGSRKRWKLKRILLSSVVIVILLIGASWISYRWLVYSPAERAAASMISDMNVRVNEAGDSFVFEPTGTVRSLSVIFYPGALVAPESYSPWARELAANGFRVYMVRMPFDLAVLGSNKADAIIAAHPNEAFVIGGHSLGGALAARYAASRADKLKGIFFMAAYADAKGSLAGTSLKALQMTGSKDGILNWQTWEAGKSLMPKDTTYVSIEGGNHGQFGSYGYQRGDNQARISEEEQHKQMTQALIAWLEGISS